MKIFNWIRKWIQDRYFTYIYTGAGHDNNWHNHANWNRGKVPGVNDRVVFPDSDDPFKVDIDSDKSAECKYLKIKRSKVIFDGEINVMKDFTIPGRGL